MKLLKVLTIVLFALFFSFSVVFSQENTTADTGTGSLPQKNESVVIPVIEAEKKAVTEKIEIEKVISDSVIKKKKSVNENKSESSKSSNKKSAEKQVLPVSTDLKEVKPESQKNEGDLLLINEGNFKYQRIPDIKLAEIKPESAESVSKTAEVTEPVSDPSAGFMGLSKTVSDIIVKGGLLLLILMIFVIYKSRMSGTGHKSSKKRNVLNSYRK